MHFLPDVYVPCEVCKGARYNRDTLEITFKGKTIADVLDMPISEAVDFFANQPAIARHMQTLVDVGLGYVRLGQSAPTLSGGEAQRVKLASELAKRSTGHTIYLLDEPTTGLHFEDVRRLLTVLSRLVDQGNTVLVIEHNLDVIKTADWLIDLGPEGGSGGGEIVAVGPPEEVAQNNRSHTGRFLAPMLSAALTVDVKASHQPKTSTAKLKPKSKSSSRANNDSKPKKVSKANKRDASGR
jgi:excinuclease ABC subunit A